MTHKFKFDDYRFEIRPIPSDEGGGYLVTFADLPGCMADGDSYSEAIENAREAFAAWVTAREEDGREIPVPGAEPKPNKILLRIPKSTHERVTACAHSDGISVNGLIVILVSEALAYREGRRLARQNTELISESAAPITNYFEYTLTTGGAEIASPSGAHAVGVATMPPQVAGRIDIGTSGSPGKPAVITAFPARTAIARRKAVSS